MTVIGARPAKLFHDESKREEFGMQPSRRNGNSLRNTVGLLHDNDSGQDLIEYVLIAGLVAISAIGVMSNLAAQVQTALQSFVQAVPNL